MNSVRSGFAGAWSNRGETLRRLLICGGSRGTSSSQKSAALPHMGTHTFHRGARKKPGCWINRRNSGSCGTAMSVASPSKSRTWKTVAWCECFTPTSADPLQTEERSVWRGERRTALGCFAKCDVFDNGLSWHLLQSDGGQLVLCSQWHARVSASAVWYRVSQAHALGSLRATDRGDQV